MYQYSRLSKTRSLPKPNMYAVALLNENTDYNYDEERVMSFKGKWRELSFNVDQNHPVDLEIGVGNGYHFANYLEKNNDRAIVGLELKYKPLIQTVNRALATGNKNFRVARYTAKYLGDLFEENEVNNVYIHFPDPWAYKSKQIKNRLIDGDFLNGLYSLQRQGSFVEFKTDHPEYFASVMKDLRATNYQIIAYTEDLHNSVWANENFQTHFEKLWTSKGLKTHYVKFVKGSAASSLFA